MRLSQEQKREALEKASREVIERLLEWEEANQAPTLTEIEDEVLALRKQWGEELVQVVLAGQEKRQPSEPPKCKGCGKGLGDKGGRQKRVESRVGELVIERNYYYCKDAKVVFFPLDRQLAIEGKQWSAGVEREAVWLSGAVTSYALTEEVLRRIGQIEMSQSSVWRRTQAAGQRFQEREERVRRQTEAAVMRWASAKQSECSTQRMGVALDGAIINIRKEGWKEVKIADVFNVAVRSVPDESTGELIDMAHAINNRYVAHLGGPEKIGALSWTLACCAGWQEAQETIVIGDSAPWIWNQAALHFGTSRQLIDWYHAKQHLHDAAGLLKQEGSAAHKRWLTSRETRLYQGHAAKIATELDKAATATNTASHADALDRRASYFRLHQRRMHYLEMRENLWPIGSGMIESGAKQFKARFSGPGMRWSRSGAEHLLPIRSTVLSRSFDLAWSHIHHLPTH